MRVSTTSFHSVTQLKSSDWGFFVHFDFWLLFSNFYFNSFTLIFDWKNRWLQKSVTKHKTSKIFLLLALAAFDTITLPINAKQVFIIKRKSYSQRFSRPTACHFKTDVGTSIDTAIAFGWYWFERTKARSIHMHYSSPPLVSDEHKMNFKNLFLCFQLNSAMIYKNTPRNCYNFC